MKKVLSVLSLSLAFVMPTMACEEPQSKPEIPDPTTAVTAQMVKSNNEVRQYVEAQQAYLSCARLGSNELRRKEKELIAYAEEFNQAIREFKLASK